MENTTSTALFVRCLVRRFRSGLTILRTILGSRFRRSALLRPRSGSRGPFASAPLVVRRLGGCKYAPVSPVRSFAAHKALIEVGEGDGLTVHVCEGLPAEDAVAVHDAVEWYVEPEHSGDWIRRYLPARTELDQFNGNRWMKEGCCRFMAAACGTNTSELNKVKMFVSRVSLRWSP